jgi:hypothetical protein
MVNKFIVSPFDSACCLVLGVQLLAGKLILVFQRDKKMRLAEPNHRSSTFIP